MNEKRKACLCGCGKPIIPKPHHRYTGIPDYIRGHWKRKRKEEKIVVLNILESERAKFAQKELNGNWQWAQGGKHAIDKIINETSFYNKGKEIRASEAILRCAKGITLYDNTEFHTGMNQGIQRAITAMEKVKRNGSLAKQL